MTTYGDFCALSRGAEVFATRWTPVIIRNLLLGCRTFTEIHDALPGISRTLLTQRLRFLEHHGVVERQPAEEGGGYVLTEMGQELAPVCYALGCWGERWLELVPDDYDAGTLLWTLSKRLEPGHLPAGRMVIRFEVTEPRQRYWLLADRGCAELCKQPPGVDEDAVVHAPASWLVLWQTGRAEPALALRDGTIRIDGPDALAGRLASWTGRCRFGDPEPSKTTLRVA